MLRGRGILVAGLCLCVGVNITTEKIKVGPHMFIINFTSEATVCVVIDRLVKVSLIQDVYDLFMVEI